MLRISILEMPSIEDFYFKKDGEEQYLIDIFFGKNIEQAKEIYKNGNPAFLTTEMRYIGTKAFCYYIFCIFEYLQEYEKQSLDDQAEVYCILVDVLEEHWKRNPNEMKLIFQYVIDFIYWAILNYEKFQVNENIFGNVKEKYNALLVSIIPDDQPKPTKQTKQPLKKEKNQMLLKNRGQVTIIIPN